MNKSNNERYRETEQRLIEAFITLLEKKDISRITIRELCEACQIHRSSFYLHFQDIYALLERIEDYLAQYYGQLFTQDIDISTRFLQFFSFIQDHRSFYKVYWNHFGTPKALEAMMPDDQTDGAPAFADRLGFSNSIELNYHLLFFRAGLTALIGHWLSRDCLETPEELQQILEREYEDRAY